MTKPEGRTPGLTMKEIRKRQEVFASAYADGMPAPDAAELAGYNRRNGSDLLRESAGVAKRVAELQRPYVISWKRLLVKAMAVLDAHLNESNGYAKELLGKLELGKQITAKEKAKFLKMLTVSASDRNTAVRLVTEVMSKINPKSLTDAAASEDAVMDKDEAIKAILGEDASGAPVDPAAPAEAEDETSSYLDDETIN